MRENYCFLESVRALVEMVGEWGIVEVEGIFPGRAKHHHQIMRLHKGSISANSVVGERSELVVGV